MPPISIQQFHEHATMKIVRKKDESIFMKCSTCGKVWNTDFQYYVKTNENGLVIDRGILQTSTQRRISCEEVDNANRMLNKDFIIIE